MNPGPLHPLPYDVGIAITQRLVFITSVAGLDIWWDPEEDGTDLNYLVVGANGENEWAECDLGKRMFMITSNGKFDAAEEIIRNLITLSK